MKAAITHFHREVNDEAPERPLDFGLIRRLFSYTQPYAAKRNWLLVLVLVRAIQLPFLSWLIGRVVKTIELAVKAPALSDAEVRDLLADRGSLHLARKPPCAAAGAAKIQ